MQKWNDYDEDDRRLPWATIGVVAAAVIALLAIGYVLVAKDDAPAAEVGTDPSSAAVSSASTAPLDSSTTTTSAAATTTSSSTSSTVSIAAPPSSDLPASTAISSPPAGASIAVDTTDQAAPPASVPSYPTLPDGSPAPIIAIFDVDKITLSGSAPSEEAKQRLEDLAILNSKFAVPVDNQLIVDPTVPVGIGVRIIELTSSRFDAGSAAIVGEHAAEFDRVVTVMQSLPDVTALVIGHADQIGNQDTNYKLSAERAAAVVDYMVAGGISPARLSSRAVGDTDLLTLDNDAASLALNRRTEFVLYGLLDT